MNGRRAITATAAFVAALVAAGCAGGAHEASAPVWPPARFIVKPRTPVAGEAQIEALVRAKLERPERVRLFRPMSGGAYVFEMVPPDARDELPAIIARLRASGAFEYVEIDAPVTIR